jgi:small GTP-binding protein
MSSSKFIVIGSSGVGKTAITKRFVDDTFTSGSGATVGAEFTVTTIDFDNHQISIQIWDTAGQEKFKSITKAYIRNALGVILVFDLTDRKSFDELNQWLEDVRAFCDPNAVIILIGNKCDLSDQRDVTQTDAESFAQSNQLKYLEASALIGKNIREAFQRTASALYYRHPIYQEYSKQITEGKSRGKRCNC